jgi:hypothetical protein
MQVMENTKTAAAKRPPSGVLREQNPRTRFLLCAM